MPNPFVHVELNTTDVDKAKAFYSALFGWKLEDMPMGEGFTYTMLDVGEGTGGGITRSQMPDAPPLWIPYVDVDDVTASTQQARSLGATVYQDVTQIPGMGAFSIIADPTGAVLGLWTSSRQ